MRLFIPFPRMIDPSISLANFVAFATFVGRHAEHDLVVLAAFLNPYGDAFYSLCGDSKQWFCESKPISGELVQLIRNCDFIENPEAELVQIAHSLTNASQCILTADLAGTLTYGDAVTGPDRLWATKQRGFDDLERMNAFHTWPPYLDPAKSSGALSALTNVLVQQTDETRMILVFDSFGPIFAFIRNDLYEVSRGGDERTVQEILMSGRPARSDTPIDHPLLALSGACQATRSNAWVIKAGANVVDVYHRGQRQHFDIEQYVRQIMRLLG